ncbi:MAG: hypothetical protein ACOC8B_04130, partial [Gemmatimonadota bacterium]
MNGSPRDDDRGSPASDSSYVEHLAGLARDLPVFLKFGGLGIIVLCIAVLAIAGAGDGLDSIAFVFVGGLVAIFVLSLVAHFYAERTRRSSAPDPVRLTPVPGQPATVGVLSFAELGTAGDEEAYGDGFAEELITRLSAMEELRLIPRRSMLAFKGRPLSTDQIAARLGVSYLVEGTLRRHGDACRVDVEVVQTWDGETWRRQWAGSWSELFALESDVAEGVAEH